jgi:hypothetical protein
MLKKHQEFRATKVLTVVVLLSLGKESKESTKLLC